MIFGREREAVRNATRAIRDLVLRPGREGSGGLGGGLGAMAMLAIGPLRELPEIATRVPGTLRDLGERMTAIPGNRRRAPRWCSRRRRWRAACAGGPMRERYLNLFAAAMDADVRAGPPRVPDVLRQLTSDEVRIVRMFQHDGPYPL